MIPITIIESVRQAQEVIASAQTSAAQAVDLIRASSAVIKLLAAENQKLLEENRLLLAEMANLRGALVGVRA